MITLLQLEKIAEFCQAVDAAYLGLWGEDELPESWASCDQTEWKERVFGYVLNSTIDPEAIGRSTERTVIFVSVLRSMLPDSSFKSPVAEQPVAVKNTAARESKEARQDQEDGWVTNPDGKLVWVGVREKQPRAATPEEIARINARIAEAQNRK